MSRTDVHRPWRVQVTDPFERHRMYKHYDWGWGTEYERLPLYHTCGCDMCTGRKGRHRERRKERALWKRNCQEARKWNQEDRIDFDPKFTWAPSWY